MTAIFNPGNINLWWANVQREDTRHWIRVSSEFGEFARQVSGRDDIIGVVEPGKGGGAPGCYLEDSVAVELNPDICAPGVAPADIHMDTEVGRLKHPVLAGVGFHEGGHAAVSRWSTRYKNAEERSLVETGLLLEETRMEKRILAKHPENRVLLRASAVELNLKDFGSMGSVTQAAHNAALLLGRVDAGVFDSHEMDAVEVEVVKAMGLGRLMAFRAIWREAHMVDDDYGRAAMFALAKRWQALIPVEEQQSGDGPVLMPCSFGGEGDGEPMPAEIAEALMAIVEAAEQEAAEQVDAAKARDIRTAREAETDEQKKADQWSKRLLEEGGHHSHGDGSESLGPLRKPTPMERANANAWARAIRKAQHRDRTKTTVSSATPPGRLRTSVALRNSAQRSMGIKATAEPWRATKRKRVENPPLAVGIICDISGSMSDAAGPVASTAWSLAHAVHQNEGDTCTVAYGNTIHPVVRPGERPAQVRTFDASGGTEEFVGALRAVDGTLDLTNGRGARLLVVISDGHYRPRQKATGEKLVRRMTKAGVSVLWLGYRPSDDPVEVSGVTYVQIASVAEIGPTVSAAIVKALKEAQA